jgi:hypothetical protein
LFIIKNPLGITSFENHRWLSYVIWVPVLAALRDACAKANVHRAVLDLLAPQIRYLCNFRNDKSYHNKDLHTDTGISVFGLSDSPKSFFITIFAAIKIKTRQEIDTGKMKSDIGLIPSNLVNIELVRKPSRKNLGK